MNSRDVIKINVCRSLIPPSLNSLSHGDLTRPETAVVDENNNTLNSTLPSSPRPIDSSRASIPPTQSLLSLGGTGGIESVFQPNEGVEEMFSEVSVPLLSFLKPGILTSTGEFPVVAYTALSPYLVPTYSESPVETPIPQSASVDIFKQSQTYLSVGITTSKPPIPVVIKPRIYPSDLVCNNPDDP